MLLVAAALLALFRMVPLKMLPFDNKNEFQIVVDMPEGTTLEHTDQVVQALEVFLQQVPEVTSIVSYTGIASPMDFNGLVRHYYLRQGGHVADMRINLAGKSERSQQSHAIVLRLRKASGGDCRTDTVQRLKSSKSLRVHRCFPPLWRSFTDRRICLMMILWHAAAPYSRHHGRRAVCGRYR